nr:hypothetical protein [uncultured Aminipila sp.]
MVDKKEWEEFRKTGLLWLINQTLHLFGGAIVVEVNEDGSISNAYPARVKFRGFTEDCNTEGYIKVSEYLADNIKELVKETHE